MIYVQYKNFNFNKAENEHLQNLKMIICIIFHV